MPHPPNWILAFAGITMLSRGYLAPTWKLPVNRLCFVLGAALLMTGCGSETTSTKNVGAINTNSGSPPGDPRPPPEMETAPLPSKTPPPTDAWIGKWTGVEGLALDIQPTETPGKYALKVTLLDGTHRFEGIAEGKVIAFTRDGVPETIRAATGEETGLKYLARKQNCLMIKQAEGFCRG